MGERVSVFLLNWRTVGVCVRVCVCVCGCKGPGFSPAGWFESIALESAEIAASHTHTHTHTHTHRYRRVTHWSWKHEQECWLLKQGKRERERRSQREEEAGWHAERENRRDHSAASAPDTFLLSCAWRPIPVLLHSKRSVLYALHSCVHRGRWEMCALILLLLFSIFVMLHCCSHLSFSLDLVATLRNSFYDLGTKSLTNSTLMINL